MTQTHLDLRVRVWNIHRPICWAQMLNWQPCMMGWSHGKLPSGASLEATWFPLLNSVAPPFWGLSFLPKGIAWPPSPPGMPRSLTSLHLIQKMPTGQKMVPFFKANENVFQAWSVPDSGSVQRGAGRERRSWRPQCGQKGRARDTGTR